MNFPIKIEHLLEYLPHRPPMVWIDQVNRIDSRTGECQLTLKVPALYWDEDRVLASAPIEWIAQTVGYCRAARIKGGLDKDTQMKETFLVGIRDAHIEGLESLKPGSVVHISAEILKELGPLFVVRGEVKLAREGGRRVAQATLKLFVNG